MRVNSPDARAYYFRECETQNWSSRELERNINTFFYERILSSKNKAEPLVLNGKSDQFSLADFIKDPYIFEFLNISQPAYSQEKQIETALIFLAVDKSVYGKWITTMSPLINPST